MLDHSSRAIQLRHPFPVAVVRQRRSAFAGIDQFLRRLRPAGMWRVWVDVRRKVVFPGAVAIPESCRPFGGEFDLDDRLDALETVLPRHDEAQRRAMLFGQRMTVDAGGEDR